MSRVRNHQDETQERQQQHRSCDGCGGRAAHEWRDELRTHGSAQQDSEYQHGRGSPHLHDRNIEGLAEPWWTPHGQSGAETAPEYCHEHKVEICKEACYQQASA